MDDTTSAPDRTGELPVLASAEADEITLGRQAFNDSDKANYFEG